MSKFIIVMWSSWSGKTTVLNESWILTAEKVKYVQSYTTRDLREWEVNGEKYNHITTDEFEAMIAKNEFLEYAQFGFSYYWTALKSITDKLDQSISPIKEMEMWGYLKLCASETTIPYVSIFLNVDEKTVIERVAKRWWMPEDELQERIKSAAFEREHAQDNCHHIIDATQPLEKVVESFIHILKAEKLL